jgi:O-antigen/teichoic acid export membrane protein
MIGGKKILFNTLWLMLSSMFNLGISIFTTSIIARSIGPGLYGRYMFGLNYILFFSVLANFGLESFFVRETARDRKNINVASDIFFLKIALAILTSVVVVLSANLLRYPEATLNVIYVFCIGLFFQILYESLMSVYRSLEKMHFMAVFATAFRVVSALIIIFAIYSGIGFPGIVCAFSITYFLLFTTVLFFVYRSYGIPVFQINPVRWLYLIRQGMPFYLSALLTMFYARISIMILSKLVDEAQMGLYMASLNLVENLFFMVTAFNTSIFPAFSRLYGTSFESLIMVYKKITKYLIIMGVAICVGTILVAEKIVVMIYGREFLAAAAMLKVLIFFWVCTLFSNTQSSLLFAIGREKNQAKIMAITCVVSVVSGTILISLFGSLGSAFSLVMTEGFVVATITLLLWRSNLRYTPDVHLVRIVFPVGLMILVVRMLIEVNIFLAILAGGATYVAFLFIAKVFDASDISYIKALVKGGFVRA